MNGARRDVGRLAGIASASAGVVQPLAFPRHPAVTLGWRFFGAAALVSHFLRPLLFGGACWVVHGTGRLVSRGFGEPGSRNQQEGEGGGQGKSANEGAECGGGACALRRRDVFEVMHVIFQDVQGESGLRSVGGKGLGGLRLLLGVIMARFCTVQDARRWPFQPSAQVKTTARSPLQVQSKEIQ